MVAYCARLPCGWALSRDQRNLGVNSRIGLFKRLGGLQKSPHIFRILQKPRTELLEGSNDVGLVVPFPNRSNDRMWRVRATEVPRTPNGRDTCWRVVGRGSRQMASEVEGNGTGQSARATIATVADPRNLQNVRRVLRNKTAK